MKSMKFMKSVIKNIIKNKSKQNMEPAFKAKGCIKKSSGTAKHKDHQASRSQRFTLKASVLLLPEVQSPDLLTHDPTLVQTFLRRAMEAKVLDAKRNNKRLSFGDITQKGKAKSFGAHSALQEVGVSVTQKNQMTKAIQDRRASLEKFLEFQSKAMNGRVASQKKISMRFQDLTQADMLGDGRVCSACP